VAQLGDKLYVIGGYPSTRVFEATVTVYDGATNSWSFGPPVPQPLHHTVAVGVNGRVYVLGGENSTTGLANQGIYFNNVYELDPQTGLWTEKSPMPTARSGGAAVVVDNKIYVAGGRPPGGSAFEMYDPATDRSTVLPNLPTQRNHLAAGAIGNKVYVAGGRFGGGVGSEMTGILEVYDTTMNTWERRADMPTPRGGVNGVAANGCLYTFGGEGNDDHVYGVFEENEVYNPVTNTWYSLEHLPIAVHGVSGLGVLNNWIHLPGGGIMRGGSTGSVLHQAFYAEMSCN
jgi:N-acetylneuraminic acid mutarotase